MPEDIKQSEQLPVEIQEVMRSLVSAIRTVKIYPPNNPVYSQSIKKSHQSLDHYLAEAADFTLGVQKTFFTCQRVPVGKDAELNKVIAQDLFSKGVREIIFNAGITEAELLELCRALALSPEELAIRSGLSTILWEKGMEHVKVLEAGLDDVITTKSDGAWDAAQTDRPSPGSSAGGKTQTGFASRTLVLGDVMTDPAAFGAGMIELAKQTKAAHESVEDRLLDLYREAGRKIEETQPDKSEALFEGLAESVLALDPAYQQNFISGKLYGDLDAEMANTPEADPERQLPTPLHEIQTGRFSNVWTVKQVATLLKRTTKKKAEPSQPVPPSPANLEVVPLPHDINAIAKELAEYSPEEMTELKMLTETGMESDIIDSSVRTLMYLLPLIKNPGRSVPADKEISLFSGVVHHLEDMLNYLLSKKEYDLATMIVQSFQMPVDPIFRPRMREALRNTESKTAILGIIADLRKSPPDAALYRSAYAYLSSIAESATKVLLEILAEEQDRPTRLFLLDLVKGLGKNQLSLLGEHLSDERWYFVRNIVSILGESKTDQAISFLRKAADHENVQIRLEVIKGLISIGGKKTVGVLAKFLHDRDYDIQMAAIHAFADLPAVGAEEATPLMAFLEGQPLKKKEQEVSLEAIKVLGRIGGLNTAEFLKRYDRKRWWKPRRLQAELRSAATRATENILRRTGNGGRTKR